MIYKTALITGGAIRIGKDICKKLHENGYNIICHYNKSENEAKDLKSKLNKLREGSCEIFSLDLNDFEQVKELTSEISNNSNSLDLLVKFALVSTDFKGFEMIFLSIVSDFYKFSLGSMPRCISWR